MPGKFFLLLLSFSLISNFSVDGFADVSPQTPQQREQIETLVEKLNSNKFSERNLAMRQLISLKGLAIGQVFKASANENPEIATRALHILLHHWDAGNEGMQELIRREEASLANKNFPVAPEIRQRMAATKQQNFLKLQGQPNVPIIVGNFQPLRVRVQPAPPQPLTPAQKAQQKKIKEYDRLLGKLETQIRRLEIKKEHTQTPNQFDSIIKKLEQQKAQIQQLKERSK